MNWNDLIAMDDCHINLIASFIEATKPQTVLELGIGSGRLTKAMQLALEFNGTGTLTAVDNWADWQGQRPDHLKINPNIRIIVSGEEEFVKSQPSDSINLLISDADHFRSHLWFSEHVRILSPGGFAFFHDTNAPQMFPGLATLPQKAQEMGLLSIHFTKSSRSDERCNRGLLMIRKPL